MGCLRLISGYEAGLKGMNEIKKEEAEKKRSLKSLPHFSEWSHQSTKPRGAQKAERTGDAHCHVNKLLSHGYNSNFADMAEFLLKLTYTCK